MTDGMRLPGDKNRTDNHCARGVCVCMDKKVYVQRSERQVATVRGQGVASVYDSSARFAWPEQQVEAGLSHEV